MNYDIPVKTPKATLCTYTHYQHTSTAFWCVLCYYTAWAPRGAKSRPSPLPWKIREKFCLPYWGLFCYFVSLWGAFLLIFTPWWKPFLSFPPPPPPTKISAGAHVTRSLLKYSDLNITEFCRKSYFPLNIGFEWLWRKTTFLCVLLLQNPFILLGKFLVTIDTKK